MQNHVSSIIPKMMCFRNCLRTVRNAPLSDIKSTFCLNCISIFFFSSCTSRCTSMLFKRGVSQIHSSLKKKFTCQTAASAASGCLLVIFFRRWLLLRMINIASGIQLSISFNLMVTEWVQEVIRLRKSFWRLIPSPKKQTYFSSWSYLSHPDYFLVSCRVLEIQYQPSLKHHGPRG